jgi:hypothetical protein
MNQSEIITNLRAASEVNELPKGAVVGDCCGGRTFNDNVAAALERRSADGWNDVTEGETRWTVIRVQR